MKNQERLFKRGAIYYYRTRIPQDLVPHYGKAEIVVSLRTKDKAEAKGLLKIKDGETEAEFRALRANNAADARREELLPVVETPASLRDVALAYQREIERAELMAVIELYEKAAADPDGFWRGDFISIPTSEEFTWFDRLRAEGELDQITGHLVNLRRRDRLAALRRMLRGDLGEMVALAQSKAANLDDRTAQVVAMALIRAEIKALQDVIAGSATCLDEQPQSSATRSPASAFNQDGLSPAGPALSLDAVFERWAVEAQPAASTLSTWRGIVKTFKAAFPHKASDMRSVTADDMVAWKDQLLAAGKSPKTINHGHLACISRLFRFAIKNRLATVNPAENVKVERRAKPGAKMIGYTDDEVARLLVLARSQAEPFKRWIPWLAATTGSRVGAVAQLWRSRVTMVNGQHVIEIQPAPDAGTIKTEESERTLPLHPALINEGFLDFVRQRGDGPLFYGRSSGNREKKHASKSVSDRLAKWIRENGFTDKRKAPNHAFRHWFKSTLINSGEDSRVVDKLQGHADKSDAATYYAANYDRMLAALKKLPLPERHDA